MDASKILIALCDGHGMLTAGKRTPIFPANSGLKSETGNFMHENEFNRAVIKILDIELRRCGFKTLLVAPTDVDTSLSDRVKLANEKKANFYLSVHANAMGDKWGSAGGIETYAKLSGEALKAATILHKHLLRHTQLKDRGVKDGAWLYLVKHTNMPTVLVECAFMDNLEEAKLLLTDAYRKECAVELAMGVCEYYGVTYVENKPVVTKPQEAIKLTNFKDVAAGTWYENSIKVASDLGIMNGDTEGNFNPSKTLTRAEMATIIAKLHEKGMI